MNILLLTSCGNHEQDTIKKNKIDLFDTLQNSTNVFFGKKKSLPVLNINEIYEASDVVVTCIPLKMDSVLNKSNKPVFYLVGARVIKVLKGKQKPYDILYFVSNVRPQFKQKDTSAAYLSQLRNKRLLAYNFKWQWTLDAPYLNQYDELGKPKNVKRKHLVKTRRRRIRYLEEIDPLRISPDLDSSKLNIIRNFTTINK
ncbi:hypothetical protein [Pedobacter punctiformis]|uniref:Lipoprotein n=1 Tax=Pedobacter punctiformis TaxID=3004097 RepID=A0ABT4L392_9SPHI|nr:hypothetical protein [Pedobacter sp. HCMS5-2]MCZ4242390.1 hypothetical protein [Pedobacter sp. HCMS5-2]